MTTRDFTSLALSFPEAEEEGHFEKNSFRVRKKIFATLHVQKSEAVLKLSPIDQSVFADSGPGVYPVPNKWGKQGWTIFEIARVHKDLLSDALTCSYREVAPKKLSNLLSS